MEVRIAIITGSRVDTNRDGEQPGRILQGVITDPADVQNIQTCQAGDEFNPPNGCMVVLGAGGSAYKIQLAVDDGIAPAMDPGGKRIYSTDSRGDAEVAEVRLHPDGKVEVFNDKLSFTLHPNGKAEVSNDLASFTMGEDGKFTFSGVSSHFDHPVTMEQTLEVATSVTSAIVAGTNDVIFAGKSTKTHAHSDSTPGDGQTGAPV